MIRVEGIEKRYGPVTALRGVTFSVARGETLGVIGPNGAGKTTLLKILLGLVYSDRGTVSVDGIDLRRDPRAVRRRIGYVPQRAVFEEFHTGLEALGLLARLRGVAESDIAAHAAQAGVDHLLARKVGTLSGGQRQRLSLAAALLGNPPVLLLDEPTASLDPEATATFRALIQRLAGEGRTLVLCSHLLADVERLCDRVLVLLEGRVAAMETMHRTEAPVLHLSVADPVKARAATADFGDLVRWNGNGTMRAELAPAEMVRLLARLHASGIDVTRLETRRPTLEDRFLAAIAATEEDRHE
jgi:ABC-type multidrug transport system ATPase subunit